MKSPRTIANWKIAGALIAGFICIGAADASAQVTKERTDGGVVTKTTPKASSVIPEVHPPVEQALPAGVSLVYSNLGTGTSVYDSGEGWTEAGAEANDYPIAEAMAFTPTNNYVLVRLDIAVTYLQGKNEMKVVLAKDNGGLPGKAIYINSFVNLPDFGTCCTVQTAKLSPSPGNYVRLISGQQYWLIVMPTDTTTYLIWNYDTTSMGGPGAVSEDYGKTWTPTTYATFGAFDLYGYVLGG